MFSSAPGLQAPWVAEGAKLDTAERRIDFKVGCEGVQLNCPQCGASARDWLRRSWGHPDFFGFEARNADMPRVSSGVCSKTAQVVVFWARPGSGFTAAFEALTLYRELPARQATALLRCTDMRLWRRIEFYVDQARALETFDAVKVMGNSEASARRGLNYVNVVLELDAKHLVFAAEGRGHQFTLEFDLKARGGDPNQVHHVGVNMSAAYAKGTGAHRVHPIRTLRRGLNGYRGEGQGAPSRAEREKGRTQGHAQEPRRPEPLATELDALPAAFHAEERAGVAAEDGVRARVNNRIEQVGIELRGSLNGARRCRLQPFKPLAVIIKSRFDAVVRRRTEYRRSANAVAKNGLEQQARRTTRGLRTDNDSIAIAYLQSFNFTRLTDSPPVAGLAN